MNADDVIEQAARFACTARPGHDHQPRLDQECAWVLAVCENLADAGLLVRPLPDRDEIEDAILNALREQFSTYGDVADAVLALLEGRDG